MFVDFKSEKLQTQCSVLGEAKKLFGGDKQLAISLLARVNALQMADTIKDIVIQQQFYFHLLKNKNGRDLQGLFAIDVKTRKEPWRIIIKPLKEDGGEYVPCNIDEISNDVKRVEVVEVSKHYE